MDRKSGVARFKPLQCSNDFRPMKFSTISAKTLSILLVSLTAIATGSADRRPMNPKEHEETYDMPPAYIFRLEKSPRMISQFGLFTSYQANVDAQGNNIVG